MDFMSSNSDLILTFINVFDVNIWVEIFFNFPSGFVHPLLVCYLNLRGHDQPYCK